jgi:hypothetical protein
MYAAYRSPFFPFYIVQKIPGAALVIKLIVTFRFRIDEKSHEKRHITIIPPKKRDSQFKYDTLSHLNST